MLEGSDWLFIFDLNWMHRERSMRTIFGRSRGQVAVIYAGLAAVLLGAAALGSDVAVMYMNWQQVQKAADASALAGANFMTGISWTATTDPSCTGQPDDASKAACTTAVKNGLTASQVAISEPTAQTIQVIASENNLSYFFGKALGLNNYNVSATAVAQAPGNIGTVTQGMFPVGLQCTSPCSQLSLDPGQTGFTPGQKIPFGEKFVNGLAPGNWQFLALGGTGDSTLGTNIDYGATGSYKIGDSIQSEPGNAGNSANVKGGWNDRMSRCQSIAEPCSTAAANPNDIPIGDPCLVVVPAVDYHNCTGSCTMTIEGFALIYLDSTSTTTKIQGCFVKGIQNYTIQSATAPDLGGGTVDALLQ
jgi:Flp pilus assembly protein TadG